MAFIEQGTLEQLDHVKWHLLASIAVIYAIYTVRPSRELGGRVSLSTTDVSALQILHVKFFSPTARVPGSLLDKISTIRFAIKGLTGRKMYFVEEQLDKYGPLVEVAPNKVACSDPEAIKTVFGSHEWRKSRFYSDFADFQDTSSLFSETGPKRAQILRKAFLPAFSRANLVAMSKNILLHLEKFLHKLDEFDQKGEPVDTYRWFRYLTFEVLTPQTADIGFGVDYDMITHGEIDHPFVKDFDDATSWGILRLFLGSVVYAIPKSWYPKSFQHWMEAQDRTETHARGGLEKWRTQKSQGQVGHRVDILQRLIDHGDKYPDEKLSEMELVTEIMEIMLAGGDTTASTVTYACYELTRFPEVQDKLRAALREAIPDPTAPIKLEVLEGIPYLDWTVKEMLRMHPTLPSTLERVVPPKGAEIAGYKLKGGTIVCMAAFIQHQREEVFPHPELFQPERWEKETDQMRLNMLAFSTGPRSCVGQK
ncbi:hypothetical protein LTS15_009689 [Exophiala xenobiotica]|nr:hypothetical protein LTS15_009689 [Exophiala xenobiotica]